MKKRQTSSTGKCVGVPGRVAPHDYHDGRDHHPESHGLCPKCQLLMISLAERRYRTKAILAHAARMA